MFCPVCKNEYEPGYTRCPDCDVNLVEELIPEASSGEHSNLSTIGFAIGFVLMMVLDVVMG